MKPSPRTPEENATERLVQRVLDEPCNSDHAQKLLQSARNRYSYEDKGIPLARIKERRSRASLQEAITSGDWGGVMNSGIALLTVNPYHAPTLLALAAATAALLARSGPQSAAGDCELFYLKAAYETAPSDADVCRQMALAMTKRERLDEAIAFWQKVEELRRNDEEATRAISSLVAQRATLRRQPRGGGN